MSLSVLLRHRFPSVRMDIDFEVPTPGVTVLFGPSGSGKSTIISAAAGLLRPDECRIAVDGQVLADTASGIWLPPEIEGFKTRRINFTFRYVPSEHVIPFAKLGREARADVRGYVEELAKSSAFFGKALAAAGS